jgi:BlaI family penicillinase repressor
MLFFSQKIIATHYTCSMFHLVLVKLTMPAQPTLSNKEWPLMRLLWEKSPQPAYDLITALSDQESWHANTVRTMLARLHKKGAVGIRPYKNLFLYSPLISEEECITAESESFLQRVYGGALKPALIHFTRAQKLTRKEILELKRVLDGKD